MSEWVKSQLVAQLTFQRGYDITKKDQKAGLYKVISSSGPKSTHSEYKALGPGVIIGRKGTLGSVFYSEDNYWPHDTSLWVKDFHGNDPKFSYYFLQIMRFEKLDVGAANPSLNRNHIHTLPVYFPPLPEQKRIAGILSAYDDLIENNLRRIKILEEMAQSLYREWFVHFSFPGHESTPMIDSPLGPIPEGWEVKEFKDIFDIKYGKTLPKSKIQNKGEYPVYGAGSVIGYYDKKIASKKCALVTCRGNGSGTIWRTREPAFVTNNSLLILPVEAHSFWNHSFIEQLLRNSNVMSAVTGSAQPQITISNIGFVKAVVPPEDTVLSFCQRAFPIYEQVDSLMRKNTNLRATRDLLLPKLLTPPNA